MLVELALTGLILFFVFVSFVWKRKIWLEEYKFERLKDVFPKHDLPAQCQSQQDSARHTHPCSALPDTFAEAELPKQISQHDPIFVWNSHIHPPGIPWSKNSAIWPYWVFPSAFPKVLPQCYINAVVTHACLQQHCSLTWFLNVTSHR